MECVFILLKYGVDLYMVDFIGNIAFYYVVYNGNKVIVSELFEYKVDINIIIKVKVV